MSCIEHADLRARHILAVAFRLAEIEREIVLAPDDQELWLRLLHPRLPLRIGRDIRAVVIEEIALNLCLPCRLQEGILISPKIWIIELDIRVVSDVACPRGFQRQQVLAQRLFVTRPIRPECPSCCPVRPKPFVVSDRVLDHESLHPLRMRQCHAKTNGSTLVLHIQRVVGQTKRLCKALDHLSNVVKRVVELFRVRPVAMTVAGIVRSD